MGDECRGPTDTPAWKEVGEEVKKREGEVAALGRLGKPKEIGEVIVMLMEERCSYVTGAVMQVDGGYTV